MTPSNLPFGSLFRDLDQAVKTAARFFALAVLGVSSLALADDSDWAHGGYIDNVREERLDPSHEVVILPLPETRSSISMEQIVPEKLSRAFSQEFRNRFGYTEYEQVEFESNRFTEIGESQGRLIPVNEYITKQESFGRYMLAKLTDYHVNYYLKHNANTRTIYEVKQKLSNVEIQDQSGYKYKLAYDLASNRLALNMEKPNEVFHRSVDVNLGGSPVTTVRLGYDVSKTIAVKTDYAIEKEALTIQGRKVLAPTLATTLTGQSFKKDQSPDVPAQDRVLIGLSWTD
jgi:hypothetical protein